MNTGLTLEFTDTLILTFGRWMARRIHDSIEFSYFGNVRASRAIDQGGLV